MFVLLHLGQQLFLSNGCTVTPISPFDAIMSSLQDFAFFVIELGSRPLFWLSRFFPHKKLFIYNYSYTFVGLLKAIVDQCIEYKLGCFTNKDHEFPASSTSKFDIPCLPVGQTGSIFNIQKNGADLELTGKIIY